MLYLLRKGVPNETLYAQKGKLFHVDIVIDRLSNKLLTSSSSIALIVTFVQRKTDYAFADQNIAIAKPLEQKNPRSHGSILRLYRSPSRPIGRLERGTTLQQVVQRSNESSSSQRATRTLNDTHPRQICWRKSTTPIEILSRMRRYYRRISDTAATVKHDTWAPGVAHRLTIMGRTDALMRNIYWSSTLSMLASGNH